MSPVPDDVQARIMDEVVALLREELPRAFPGRELELVKDGQMYRICGDLSLD